MPELNLQAMEALTKANEVRLCRAQDKDLIRRGKLDPLAILELPPDHWRTAKVIDVLLAMHRVGRARAGNWLTMANVPATRRLEDLTPRQRHDLAGYVAYALSAPAWFNRTRP